MGSLLNSNDAVSYQYRGQARYGSLLNSNDAVSYQYRGQASIAALMFTNQRAAPDGQKVNSYR